MNPFIAGLMAFALPLAAAGAEDLTTHSAVLQQAQDNILALRQEGSYWNLPPSLGSQYVAQYYLATRILDQGARHSSLDAAKLKAFLLERQLGDGSWYAVRDANLKSGDLNATILNYWALKAMGMPVEAAPLSRARSFILARGGLEKSALFTKIYLALFQNYPWSKLPSIPYALFTDLSPVNEESFAQWIGPHLMPIAYLRSVKVSRNLGAAYSLNELWVGKPELPTGDDLRSRGIALTDYDLVNRILRRQQPRGSWGGYTSATLLTLFALEHFSRGALYVPKETRSAIDRAYSFVDRTAIQADPSYPGSVADGRYWDTALVGIAGIESGLPSTQLEATAKYLESIQSPNGGFAFGEDFGYAPDTDDTAETLIFLSRFPGSQESAKKGLNWLISMQNDDGGWGAFARNNTENELITRIASPFLDSADLFDESSPDVSGHILEALSYYGMSSARDATARRAVEYLWRSQLPAGTWSGRWGINHIYGTSAALIGLLRAGESASDPRIQKAVAWFFSIQNADGGFGESSLSYTRDEWIGRGVSTPSQTAWALMALIEAGAGTSEPAHRAASFLVQEFQRDGKWFDKTAVGTGHPGIIYMDYPSYAYAFPVMALSRYLAANRR